MKKAHLVIGLLAGMGFASCLSPQAMAQSVLSQPGEVRPTDTFKDQQNSDPFSGVNEGGGFNVYNLIHRAQLGGVRSLDDYSADQRQHMDKAAEQFRLLQQQRLRENQQAAPQNSTAPAANPAVIPPTQN